MSLLFLIGSCFFSLQGMQKSTWIDLNENDLMGPYPDPSHEKQSYTQPKNAAVLLKHPKVNSLLICYDEHKGAFVTPGGVIDEDETPPEAALRELMEETATYINLNKNDLMGPYLDPFHETAIFHATSPTDDTWDIKKHYNSKLPSLKNCETEMNDWLWMRWDQLVIDQLGIVTANNGWFSSENIKVKAYREANEEDVILKSYVANSILNEIREKRLEIYHQ